MSMTGERSRTGARLAGSRRSRRRRPPSRRSWPHRPTVSSGRSRSPAVPRRSPRHTAPRITPTRAIRARSPLSCRGIRRKHGTRSLRKAQPLELDPLARLLEPIDTTTLAGLRDRALLLLGFAAALRRSELVALDVEDLEFDAARGLLVTIRKSKTDQERAGAQVAVPYARARNNCARSGRSGATSRLPASIAARCFARCAAATPSPSSASQTSRSR